MQGYIQGEAYCLWSCDFWVSSLTSKDDSTNQDLNASEFVRSLSAYESKRRSQVTR